MADTNHTVLVEAVEARDELIKRLAVDLLAARATAQALATRVHNLTEGAEGGTQRLPWDRNYNWHAPANISISELDAIQSKVRR